MIEGILSDIGIFGFVKFSFVLFALLCLIIIGIRRGISLERQKLTHFALISFVMVMHAFLISYRPLLSFVETSMALAFIALLVVTLRVVSGDRILLYIDYVMFSWILIVIIPSFFILISNMKYFQASGVNFSGVVSNSNVLALYVILINSRVLVKITAELTLRNASKLLLSIACMILVYYSNSRSAFALLIFQMIILINVRFSGLKRLVFNGCSILIVSTFLLTQNGSDFFNKNGKNSTEFVNTREFLWAARLYAISVKPHFGWGFTVNEFVEFRKGHVNNRKEKGNLAFALVEEFGIYIGPTLFLFITVLTWKSIYFYVKSDLLHHAIFLVSVWLHSLVETWILNYFSLFTWIFWTILLFPFLIDLRSFERRFNGLLQ